MIENDIQKTISYAKKFNVARKATFRNKDTKKLEWGRNLKQVEDDFKIKLDEDDKKGFLKEKKELEKDLREKHLHKVIIKHIPNLYAFEEKESKDGKKRLKPTKEAATLLNDFAELMGLLLKAFDISTSQIRKYLDSLRKVKVNSTPETFSPSDVLLQQVKIAYAVGRNSDLDFFYEVLKPAINEGSKSYEYFEQLLRFVEAIIAYHRFYRGED